MIAPSTEPLNAEHYDTTTHDLVLAQDAFAAAALLKEGIRVAKTRRPELAYDLLRQAAELAPNNARAWLWLGAVAPDAATSLRAFEYALSIERDNKLALAGRTWALERLASSDNATGSAAAQLLHAASLLPTDQLGYNQPVTRSARQRITTPLTTADLPPINESLAEIPTARQLPYLCAVPAVPASFTRLLARQLSPAPQTDADQPMLADLIGAACMALPMPVAVAVVEEGVADAPVAWLTPFEVAPEVVAGEAVAVFAPFEVAPELVPDVPPDWLAPLAEVEAEDGQVGWLATVTAAEDVEESAYDWFQPFEDAPEAVAVAPDVAEAPALSFWTSPDVVASAPFELPPEIEAEAFRFAPVVAAPVVTPAPEVAPPTVAPVAEAQLEVAPTPKGRGFLGRLGSMLMGGGEQAGPQAGTEAPAEPPKKRGLFGR